MSAFAYCVLFLLSLVMHLTTTHLVMTFLCVAQPASPPGTPIVTPQVRATIISWTMSLLAELWLVTPPSTKKQGQSVVADMCYVLLVHHLQIFRFSCCLCTFFDDQKYPRGCPSSPPVHLWHASPFVPLSSPTPKTNICSLTRVFQHTNVSKLSCQTKSALL